MVARGADVIVIGLGAMGSAAAWQLARRGLRVLGIDQYAPPHALGSTHGDSRVTRVATAEGAAYVPLAARSHELWREIEGKTGAAIFSQCGVLMAGPPAGDGAMHGVGDWVAATGELAGQFGVEHELLTGSAARERYPFLALGDDSRAYFEPGGGLVRPEAAVTAQLELAQRCGATLRTSERVLGVTSDAAGARVTTDGGEYRAQSVVLAVGAWASGFFADPALQELFAVVRQELHWFDLDPAFAEAMDPSACPVYMWSYGMGADDFFYGFPAIDGPQGGAKVATEQFAETTTVADVRRGVEPDDAAAMYQRCLRGRHLALTPRSLRSVTCLYTLTPDGGFVVAPHPELEHVTVVSPCSGHGFKHSAAIGEAVAQQLVDGAPQIDLAPFGFERLLT